MIITISGLPGAGKTSIAKLLAEKLRYKHLSGGDIRGQIALKHGLTIDQLNDLGTREIWTDKELDDEWIRIGKEEDSYVIDSWIAFHFIPNSIKIFLKVNPKVGAERIIKEPRPDEKPLDSIKDIEAVLQARVENTNNRYKKYYNTNFLDESNYNFVLDTSNLSKNEVIEKLISFIKSRGK